MKKVAWVTSWSRVCGIADYAHVLWRELLPALQAHQIEGRIFDLDQPNSHKSLLESLRKFSPDIIHFQHEYGLYGGKNPPRYQFPALIGKVRAVLPGAVLIATAHTVIESEYRFPVAGKGSQTGLRAVANLLLLPYLRKIWNQKTWGVLDGVIVHSKRQLPLLKAAGAKEVSVIPHFVQPSEKALPRISNDPPTLLVFGFFTPEKGQDVVIRALPLLSDPSVTLILAGGSRRTQDVQYQEQCEALISELKLQSRVKITGFVPTDEIDSHYAKADLVIVPFRATSGSGSITHAFARGLPVLASDLPLNLELNDREPGVLEFFKSEDAADCAAAIERVLKSAEAKKFLHDASLRYAKAWNPQRVAKSHLDFYHALEYVGRKTGRAVK